MVHDFETLGINDVFNPNLIDVTVCFLMKKLHLNQNDLEL